MSAPQPYSSPSSSSSVPLDAPLYGASLPDAVRRFFAKYATFSGRASRSEYWWWTLVNAIVFIVLYVILIGVGGTAMMMSGSNAMSGMASTSMGAGGTIIGILLLLWSLAIIVPSIALTVRRLHDANLSGFFYFLVLVPGVGGIIVLILTLLPSNPLGARFDALRSSPAV